MSLKNKLAVLTISLMILGFAFVNLTISEAQQMPTNSKTEEALPTPPPLTTPTPEIDETDDIIKIDTEVVNVLFTAQDKKRRLLTTLKEGDVRLLENGQPQELIAFTRKVDLPLSLAILIDTSSSQERTLPEEKDAAKSFIESVIRAAKDEVSVLSFTGETTLEQGMTGNISRLHRAVDRVEFVPPSGYVGGGVVVGGRIPGTPPISGTNQASAASTSIWDAIWITSNEILASSPEKTRRAIILLSDGYDTYSSKKFSEAVEEALKAEAVIYSIGIGDNFYSGVNESALKKLSERTGGNAFFPRDEGELRQAFRQIQDEMRSQYQLVYAPVDQKRDGSYRNIEIQLVNPELAKQKVKLIHREGYFAKSDKAKGK